MTRMRDKIDVYESIFHRIQMLREVVMDKDKLLEVLDIIGSWSYAHRSGNGELSENEQQERIDYQFNKMKENLWGKQEDIDATMEKCMKIIKENEDERNRTL